MTTLPQTAPMRLPRAMIPSQMGVPGPVLAGPAVHPAGGTQSMTAADVWRVLRAHAWLIVIMVMGSAVAGYGVNRYLAKYHSRYTAKGLVDVRVKTELPMPGRADAEGAPDVINLQQTTQARMLEHGPLFLDALQDPESKIRQTSWFKQFLKDRARAAQAVTDQSKVDFAAVDITKAQEDWEKNWTATPIATSRLLRVEMTHSNPEDCKIIVEELVNKHIDNLRKSQLRIEEKKVDLLKQEKKLVEIELNEEIRKQLREKEVALGLDQVGTSLSWSGKQFQLDRLLQEEARIRSELAGYQARLRTLKRSLDEGRTPAEVEAQINNSGRYLQARQRLDDIDIELEALTRKVGEKHDLVIAWKQRRELYQQKLDETRDELRSTYSETMQALLTNEVDAASANADRVAEAVTKVSGQLGELNKLMTEYRQLQDRERELVKKQNYLTEEITKITQFAINAPWAQADWAPGGKPQKPDRPSFPVLWKSMGVAVFLGLALSLGIAFLRELTDTSVRSPRDIAKVGQLNLLGMVPHEADDPQAQSGRLQLAIFDAPHSIMAEQFRQVRTKLQHMTSLDTTRSILVTSPSPDDGKTTVACNLAASLALNGRRILLVDANFRRPQLHAVFNLGNEAGFADALNDLEQLDTLVRETEVPNLAVLPTGAKPTNPTELLESQLFIDFVERAMEQYDHIVFDAGPLLMVSDAIALAPRVDGVVTVCRARGNSRGLLMRLRDELRKVRAEHLGVVLNAVRSQGGGYYGRNIKTYYAYQNA